jgi:hypothetical protein
MISYEDEYPLSYKYIDVKDKIVLDIGADIGTSAKWFIEHGASKVIAYSLDLQEIFDDKIEWHFEWHGEYIKADVLKIDCEGCECMLTQNMIEKYKEWYIAIHKFAFCYYAMKKYLKSVGKLVYVTPDKKERMYVRSYYE